jgi:hypothetical protein
VSLKITLIDGNIFNADNALEPLDFENGIHQQEGIAVRKNFLDARVVENHFIASIYFPGGLCKNIANARYDSKILATRSDFRQVLSVAYTVELYAKRGVHQTRLRLRLRESGISLESG